MTPRIVIGTNTSGRLPIVVVVPSNPARRDADDRHATGR